MYIRKALSIVLLISIIISLFSFSSIAVGSSVIYQTSVKQTITSGATLEKITRFTNDGWLKIDVLRVDLSNPYVNVDTLSSDNSLHSLTQVKTLAQARGAVAAVNASFFNFGGKDAIGPQVQSGSLLTAYNDFNQDKTKDSFATLAISNANKVLYDYWNINIALKLPDGKTLPVGRYNKPYYGYTDLSIMDRKVSEMSIGTDKDRRGAADVIEMVVDGGKVVEIRQSQPPTEIPVNGYVVVTRREGTKLITDNFHVGDTIDLSISTTPDWQSLKMAVTGGAMLVNAGIIPQKFSQNPPSGRHPRTAIGSTKDGKQLMLVTVDGRGDSIGMTQKELAEFMLELGAYYALNFDGGGSTTMVARTPGNKNLSVVNNPSDGSQRSIATGVGIFSLAPPSALDGLIINTEDTNVFVNTSRTFSVKGYDRYFNPIDIKAEDIKWSVSGVEGSFKGSTFYPTTVGNAKVKAQIGNVSAQVDISALSAPEQLELSSKALKIPLEETATFTVKGKNKNGFYAVINPIDVKWKINGDIGTFKGGTFTPKRTGIGYIEASVGNARSYCSVSVAVVKRFIKDRFENENASFTPYPASVKGSYEISAEQRLFGDTSGKLQYDFPEAEGSRAAYMVFPNGGITLDSNTIRVGLWVYNTYNNPNWLGAWITDTKGKNHYVYFTKGMDWTGWKYLETSIQDISSPSKISRVYMVQPNPIPDSGAVYIDNLTFTNSSYLHFDPKRLPKDTIPVDVANVKAVYAKNSNAFLFSVFAQSKEPKDKNSIESLLLTKLSAQVGKDFAAAAFIGNSSHEIVKTIKKPFISTNTGYKSFDIKSSRFIQLDTSKKSLRTSSSNQWTWLMQQLNSFKGNNVFIFMADSPQSFYDKLEAGLFQDILTQYRKSTGRNIWVFYKGNANTSYMEKGIKYISTCGFDAEGFTQKTPEAAKQVVVTVKDNIITYELKSIN
ncbi:MAG: phosphodiester glycosidase family protein [Clostridia bacterium]|nr:phosphodiester glycosidase family protein [Clostridia bacterium]